MKLHYIRPTSTANRKTNKIRMNEEIFVCEDSKKMVMTGGDGDAAAAHVEPVSLSPK